MTLRTHRLRIAARIATNNARRWEMRRWSAIVLRLSPRITLRPELLD